jgi:ketosteroid isomerase-like protein
METDEQRIRGLMEEWHRCTAQGELEPVLGLMTEDAVS